MLPVFVINLDRRPDRWTAIMGQLDRLRIEAMRIPGIDAGSIVGSIHDGLSLPQSGCRESHLVAISEFLRTDAPASLILEDDAELAPDVRRLLASVEWWPAGTNAIKLNGRRKALLLGRPIGETPYGSAIRPISWASAGAYAYMLNRAGAEIILNMASSVGMTADSMLFHMPGSPIARRLKPSHVVPGIARHADHFGSDNEGEFFPRTTGPAVRAVLKARICLRRMTGQVRRVEVPYRP